MLVSKPSRPVLPRCSSGQVADMNEDTQGDQQKRASELGAALFFLIWAGVGWASIVYGSKLLSGRSYGLDPGPALLPVITLTILTVGAVAMAAMAIVKRGRRSRKPASRTDTEPLPIIFLSMVAIFPILLETLGYIWATLASVFVWSVLLAPNALQRPFHTMAVSSIAAISMTLLVYAGFELVIGALLPR